MPPKALQPFVEDFDESSENIVPNSQQVANTGAKVSSRLDSRLQEPLIDVASDSGYSSRTAATVNSTQSGPSGGRSPPPLKTDLPKQRTTELARTTSHRDRRDRDKERAARREEKVQMAAYGPSHLQTRMHRSPSKSNRRNSYAPSPADIYYEGSRPYHTSTPVDAPPMDYHSPMFARPPVPDFPPMSPYGMGGYEQEYHSSRSAHPHSGSYRSTMYHQDPRTWTVGLRGGYPQHPQHPQHPQQPLAPPPPPNHGYDRGPPPSGAWGHGHQGSYSSSPYGAPSYMQSDYYPQEPMYRERSESRPRDPSRRRPSLYTQQLPPPPPIAAEADLFSPEWDDEQDMEGFYRQASEKPRGRVSKAVTPDYDDDHRRRRMSKAPSPDYEDARRMMPPPSRPVQKAAKIHQRPRAERKAQSSTAVPNNRHSALDMFELDDLLQNDPDYAVPRRAPKELPPALGRSQSVQGGRRSTSYRENRRSGVMENSLRRSGRDRETYYHDTRGSSSVEDMEETERDAEEYQRMTSGLPSNGHLPLSEEALQPKARTGLPSETGSRKSGSNSSRGSATKTEKENQNMTLSLNGMSIAFAEESLTGKSISIRTGDQGSMQFNITDGTTRPRPPKQYVQESAYSERTGSGSRRALEDASSRYMRTRDDGRSEKSVHRSSRSGRSNHGQRYH